MVEVKSCSREEHKWTCDVVANENMWEDLPELLRFVACKNDKEIATNPVWKGFRDEIRDYNSHCQKTPSRIQLKMCTGKGKCAKCQARDNLSDVRRFLNDVFVNGRL